MRTVLVVLTVWVFGRRCVEIGGASPGPAFCQVRRRQKRGICGKISGQISEQIGKLQTTSTHSNEARSCISSSAWNSRTGRRYYFSKKSTLSTFFFWVLASRIDGLYRGGVSTSCGSLNFCDQLWTTLCFFAILGLTSRFFRFCQFFC